MNDETREVETWLVERTYSDDEQNLIILTYATTDGTRYLRKERALTSFEDERDTTAGLQITPGRLAAVHDEELRDQYATEAQRMAANHSITDVI